VLVVVALTRVVMSWLAKLREPRQKLEGNG
jgi:hypothetical protein